MSSLRTWVVLKWVCLGGVGGLPVDVSDVEDLSESLVLNRCLDCGGAEIRCHGEVGNSSNKEGDCE